MLKQHYDASLIPLLVVSQKCGGIWGAHRKWLVFDCPKELQLFGLLTVDGAGSAYLPELILHVNKVTSLQVKVCCDIQSLKFYILNFLDREKRKGHSGSLTA